MSDKEPLPQEPVPPASEDKEEGFTDLDLLKALVQMVDEGDRKRVAELEEYVETSPESDEEDDPPQNVHVV